MCDGFNDLTREAQEELLSMPKITVDEANAEVHAMIDAQPVYGGLSRVRRHWSPSPVVSDSANYAPRDEQEHPEGAPVDAELDEHLRKMAF